MKPQEKPQDPGITGPPGWGTHNTPAGGQVLRTWKPHTWDTARGHHVSLFISLILT